MWTGFENANALISSLTGVGCGLPKAPQEDLMYNKIENQSSNPSP